MDFKSSFRVNATLVSNEFIDTYMASANGEYIKEYLFLLRHEGEAVTVSMIADAVNHTESDVARALAYWKRQGSWRNLWIKFLPMACLWISGRLLARWPVPGA